MPVHVYLTFNGDCEEAVLYYADVFQTEKPEIMYFKDVPPSDEMPLTKETENLVLHARIQIDGNPIMFSDVFPGMDYTIGNNINVTVVHHDEEYIRNAFEKLGVNGKVGMELQETFWSPCYGSVTDKFGVEWQLSVEKDGN
ncbi:VOC family protein [Oceanobacillus piezotolerans]|uniref:VOC family protein n=1 Tax=Oceanobacillus piezotolerans TaxID=2448030 RepID=A0A498DDG9_9BACI|nr:VOC family protein [Oceanobacillus piezotolerans]RLL46710.1 VOC family protein [Oceanobacillus piezotolerans]